MIALTENEGNARLSFSLPRVHVAIVGIEMGAARGTVAVVGHLGLMDFSTFSVPLMTALAIASGTDYAIFILGRYQEARRVGEQRTPAFFTMYRGTAHVIIGSGLTIAGAVFCLTFTRLPYFQSLGVPHLARQQPEAASRGQLQGQQRSELYR